MSTASNSPLFIFSSLILLMSPSVHSQSVAKAGQQCTGTSNSSYFSCTNPDPGDDVRLFVSENIVCKNGNATVDQRTISGHIFDETFLNSEPELAEAVFSGVRTHFDDERADLSIEMPKSAIVKNSKVTYKMDITTEVEEDYEGADMSYAWHYKGSFQKIDPKGKSVGNGRLFCSFNR